MAHTAFAANLSIASLFNYDNDVALITGGATGLGETAAQALIQNGARVIIASRKKSELETTTKRLNSLGPGKCEYVIADLKDKAGCDALCAEVKKRTDRLSILINNSGATWGAPYDDFPEAGWDKIMALNVKAVYYTTVGLHSLLIKGATTDIPSRVINIASIAGIVTKDLTVGDEGGLGRPGDGAWSYAASKAAVILYSKTLASKLMSEHVTVNVVCPGVFPSRMSGWGVHHNEDLLLSEQPSGRLGKPEDYGGLILFLTSRGAAHITGETFVIDGGSSVSGFKGKKPARQGKL